MSMLSFPKSKFSPRFARLIAPKEDGAVIEYNGKKVALGIPGAQRHSGVEYLNVPLRRVGAPDDAAGAVLLYEFFAFMGVRTTDDLLQFGFTACLLCVRAHIGSDRGCWNIIHMLLCIMQYFVFNATLDHVL
jgi:hypothetical protein